MLDFTMDLSSHKGPKTSEGGVVKFSEAGSTHKCLHSEWGKTAPQPPQHVKATLACIYCMLDFMMDLSSHNVPTATGDLRSVPAAAAPPSHTQRHPQPHTAAPPATHSGTPRHTQRHPSPHPAAPPATHSGTPGHTQRHPRPHTEAPLATHSGTPGHTQQHPWPHTVAPPAAHSGSRVSSRRKHGSQLLDTMAALNSYNPTTC